MRGVLKACPNCQGKVSDQVAVCPHCGAPLLKPVRCRVCGEMVPAGETTCPSCDTQIGGPVSQPSSAAAPPVSGPKAAIVGAALEPEPQAAPAAAPNTRQQRSGGLPPAMKKVGVAVAAVAVLLFGLLGAYLLLRKTDAQCQREASCDQAGLCSATFQACVAATSADCSKSQNCREYGECTAQHGRCVVASDADCAAICETSDRCVAREGRCVCDPKRAASCLELGKCGVDAKGWCTSYTQQGCKSSSKCREEGFCTLAESKDGCVAGSNQDCASSQACANDGRCEAKDGRCVRIDCKASDDCKTKGRCTTKAGACVATSDEACTASTWCRTLGRCAAKEGECRATELGCKESELCRDKGACFVSTDGEICVTASQL